MTKAWHPTMNDNGALPGLTRLIQPGGATCREDRFLGQNLAVPANIVLADAAVIHLVAPSLAEDERGPADWLPGYLSLRVPFSGVPLSALAGTSP